MASQLDDTLQLRDTVMTRNCLSWRVVFSAFGVLGVLGAIGAFNQVAIAQYTFVQDTAATGLWDVPARWTDGASNTTYPNAIGATVVINQPIKTGNGTYTLTLPAGNTTVGEITMNNAGFTNNTRTFFAQNVSGSQLVFQASSGSAKYTETPNTGTSPANFQNQIQTNILVASDLIIDQNNYPNLNTGTIFTGIINGASNRTITKAGVGGIQFNYSFALGAGEGFEGQYLIQQGTMRLINSSSAIAKSSGITVSSGGQLQLADNSNLAVSDYQMAAGAVLNLNGAGATANGNGPGALRFAITTAGDTMTFHNPVNLQSDSTISATIAGTFSVVEQIVSGPGALTKVGPGKLTLQANNTYTGETAVNAGILSITNPYLADSKDVKLLTGAMFDLNFAGTDTIRSLFFDGLPQAVGTWGAPGSGATNESAFFTGTGLLSVTTMPPVGVAGDYNGNGVVDAADYVLWRHGGPLQNEVDTPGTVTAQDYTEWRARFGNTSGSGALLNESAVPEPTAASLILLALGTLAAAGRKR
jgi:autotransporter-associated beta strand protein